MADRAADHVAGVAVRLGGEAVGAVAADEAVVERVDVGLGRAVDDVGRARGGDRERLLQHVERPCDVADLVVVRLGAGAGRGIRAHGAADGVAAAAARLRAETVGVVAADESAVGRGHRRRGRAVDDVARVRGGDRERLLDHLEGAGDVADVVVPGLPAARRAGGGIGADRVARRVTGGAVDVQIRQGVARNEPVG